MRMRFAQGTDGALCECARLVESALLLLAAVEWHRNDEQVCWRIGDQLHHGSGKQCAEPMSDRLNAFILQRVNDSAHAAVVGSKGDGSLKGRWNESAGSAEIVNGFACQRVIEGITAAATRGPVVDRDSSPAGITDRS